MVALDNDDLEAIRDLVEVTVEQKLEGKLDDKLGHLPTKDDFYGMMDKIMGELKSIREEQAVQSQHLSDQDDRIEQIESGLDKASN